ncbi:uncharacterized protein BT62DRAFT_926541 [Guyanagaster necrorhizus]|uniref:KN homeodomain domain-containing protein n=1 Tax=Guyanagaster necrorhizus TaxID=856835 RepID=A0A9P7W545_9AGAR|nr:uncharacterized protein BT62DRAFT_926541 [Guyanagaster necrorhizus MCA 3950]KAG7452339.1 hypothetical protein BT62DRAFT_926541 [Guyanagaster necrorhizus MCA 3950]
MSACAESDLHSRLLSVVDGLFDSHNTSPTSLQTYNLELADLEKDLIDSQSSGTLHSQTAELACSVAKAIELVCQTFMNLHVQSNNILQDSEKELCAIEGAEKATPPPPARTSKKRTHSSTSPEPPAKRKRMVSSESVSSESGTSSSPDYSPLYTWLSNNLYNPYPSAPVRADLCRAAGGADVERWFTTARRRIGWTELVRRVAGGRSKVVSAAEKYWKGEGREYQVEFALIEQNLKDIYGARFGGPGEVVKLFGAVPCLKRKRDESQEEERPPKTFQADVPPNLDNWFDDIYSFPNGNVQLDVQLPAPIDPPPVLSDLDSFQAVFDTSISDIYSQVHFDISNFDFPSDPSWSTDPIFSSFDFAIPVS